MNVASRLAGAARLAAAARLAVAALALVGSVCAARAQIRLTDVIGREVEIARPARRILLESPSYYPALSLLRRDAASLVVGIGGTRVGHLSDAERDLAEKPVLGWILNQTFSVEKALALKPDLVIVGAAAARRQYGGSIEAAFTKAGIPVVYVDFFLDAARNTVPSIEAIGRALGEDERAKQFVEFHRSRLALVSDRIARAGPASRKVMFYAPYPSSQCCTALGNSGLASYFKDLRATNIADGRVPGVFGQLSLEYVIENAPDTFVVVDGGSLFGRPRTVEHAAASLEKLRDQPGFRDLAAMRDRRLHVIDASFSRSPLNVVTLELLAKWLHPALFADLDPLETLDEINRRFLATPLEGPFWASVDPANPSDGRR